jgi:sucrose-6F-phosphate phosphohydrolase
MKPILLCSDLDRTLIPNGAKEESARARPLLFRLAALRELRLAYVSGRDKALVKAAIEDYRLPEPDFVIGDVGATLYRVDGPQWRENPSWSEEIGNDWADEDHDGITALLADMEGKTLELQAPEKQGRYKVSYYTDAAIDAQALKNQIAGRLDARGIACNLIWSRDEAEHRGLLDILPERAGKAQAIRYLMKAEGFGMDRTVFAGDSGNDLDVLTSGLQAILVNNAADDVRRSALARLSEHGMESSLYLAKGEFFGMNGNYAAGVLEGLVHFFPQTASWIESALDQG